MNAFLEVAVGYVAPAAFNQKHIPDLALFIRAGAAFFVAPGQALFVGFSREYLWSEVGVANSQKAAAAGVEHARQTVTVVLDIFGGEFADGVQTDLVEHAAEVNEAADLGVGAAETGDVWHDARERGRTERHAN
jgi:hypothetical protein